MRVSEHVQSTVACLRLQLLYLGSYILPGCSAVRHVVHKHRKSDQTYQCPRTEKPLELQAPRPDRRLSSTIAISGPDCPQACIFIFMPAAQSQWSWHAIMYAYGMWMYIYIHISAHYVYIHGKLSAGCIVRPVIVSMI